MTSKTHLANNEEIHNHNSWSFLSVLKKELGEKINHLPAELKKLINVSNHFNKTYLYRLDYSSLIRLLSKMTITHNNNPDAIDALNTLYKSVYLNNNHALNYTYKQIAEVINAHTPSSSTPLTESISNRLSSEYEIASIIYTIPSFIQTIHDLQAAIKMLSTLVCMLTKILANSTLIGTTPQNESSTFERAKAFWGSEYHPMERTSIPSLLDTPWLKNVKQIRLGTQAIRENNTSSVNPLFKKFLQSQKHSDAPKKITHIYFNLLNYDKEKKIMDSVSLRNVEASYTAQLIALEKNHPNVAVITLPASCAILNKNDSLDVTLQPKKPILAADVQAAFLDIIDGKGKGITDFYISDSVRNRLDAQEIKNRLTKSFEALGVKCFNDEITPAHRQAIWFHFMKFEFPDYLISTLQPESMSTCCKDGIDRGGIASAYFNLLKSFEPNSCCPMTENQFHSLIQAPSAMVKSRGLNSHNLNLLWNVIDAYVQANYLELMKNPSHQWLIEWRDLHCPKKRSSELLQRNLALMKKHSPNDANLKAIVDEIIIETEKVQQQVKPSFLLEVLIHARNLTAEKQMTMPQTNRFAAFYKKHESMSWFSTIKEWLNRLIQCLLNNKGSSKDAQKYLRKKLEQLEFASNERSVLTYHV